MNISAGKYSKQHNIILLETSRKNILGGGGAKTRQREPGWILMYPTREKKHSKNSTKVNPGVMNLHPLEPRCSNSDTHVLSHV
jgi:hypothetical protein